MGFETEQKENAMKKQFAKLSKAEQEKVELEYHHMKPKDFDEALTQAKSHKPETRPALSARVKQLRRSAPLR